jgi:hypothetical protein
MIEIISSYMHIMLIHPPKVPYPVYGKDLFLFFFPKLIDVLKAAVRWREKIYTRTTGKNHGH